MDNIESLYFAQTGVTAKDDSKYYLFVVDKIISAEEGETAHEVNGYMPRNKKVGFISSTSNTTIAHELGHGMFRLAHTWQLDESQAQASTNNLMDYKNGIELLGAQWSQIQDPAFDIYGLDKVEDGQLTRKEVNNNKFVIDLLNQIKTSFDNQYGIAKGYIDFGKLSNNYGVKLKNDETKRIIGDYLEISANDLTINQKEYSYIKVEVVNEPYPYSNQSNTVVFTPYQITKFEDDGLGYNENVIGISENSIPDPPFIKITAVLKKDEDKYYDDEKTIDGQTELYKFLTTSEPVDKSKLVLFVNGYRNNLSVSDLLDKSFFDPNSLGNLGEYSESTNQVYYNSDFFNYWDIPKDEEKNVGLNGGIDDLFLKELTPDGFAPNAVYADGHHWITSSNHNLNNNIGQSKTKFTTSMINSFCAADNELTEKIIYFDKAVEACHLAPAVTPVISLVPYVGKPIAGLVNLTCKALLATWVILPNDYKEAIKNCEENKGKVSAVKLDVIPNVTGYNKRFNAGKLAGQNLLTMINNQKIPVNSTGKITIDIVAHSMGFAYAQGMIEVLKSSNRIKFGRYYILAPENACSSAPIDMSLFEEVWQYGSNESEMTTKPWELDGIAPQCKVTSLPDDNRVYIPSTDPNRDFLGAHYGASYEWIFKEIDNGEPGFIKKR